MSALKKQEVTVELTTINCGECGGTYAINERYREQKATAGGSWNCPYCRVGWGYSNNNENARLKKELTNTQKRLEWQSEAARKARDEAEHQRRVGLGYKGALVKTKKRIGKGTCPCCKRHFSNVEKHMATKHPEYADTVGAALQEGE